MIHARFIRIEEQWNVIYLPERPNGFAVFLLGDNAMGVEEGTSDWEQHPEKHLFLKGLLSRGYTVVASSLYNRHWGSPKAFYLIKQLYHLVLKQEILNKKIHLFAEGTGALLAVQMLNTLTDKVRSCYFVNPCFSLSQSYLQEEQNKLYYKRLRKELANSYDINEKDINIKWVESVTPRLENNLTPPPISIHCHMLEKRFPLQYHSRPFQKQLADNQIFVNLRIHVNEQSFYKAAQSAYPFYKKYEQQL
ncbi:hypothetical protein [Halalkalibacter krulwichiae]|uniref:Alpha/beta hydrolase family protein n=1 Tax=Halalkalibacter krulwichiae TaxID=199441 RepID=A0A1X9MG54_9BACI|nr:hypothetical protein [Halalkalibacter krulwichiae]ARK31500.1 hypothetical protein BkAM31D_17555 [Halalkalibacter krulwichiae]